MKLSSDSMSIISRVQGAGSCSCDMLGIVTSKEQEQESGVKLLSTIVRPPGTNHMPPGTNHMPPGTTTRHDNDARQNCVVFAS
jgi:hypothetical protein